MGAKDKIKKYIETWINKGYEGGIPDEAPSVLEKRGVVPSYRMICIAIMRNPNNLESLGIKRTKCKIYSDLKRIEISQRPNKNKQLKLF